MTQNRQTVERYMTGFNTGDHDLTAACLTDDAEWVLPGGFHLVGRDAFRAEAEKVGPGSVTVTVSRFVEAEDVVVAEGTVRSAADAGATVNLAFCDVFELREGRIRRLTSYVVPLTERRPGAAAAPAVPDPERRASDLPGAGAAGRVAPSDLR